MLLVNELWDTFGYSTFKYSKDLWALCGGNEYIWIYRNKGALIEDMKALRNYGYGNNYNLGGLNILEIHGPCGPIRI